MLILFIRNSYRKNVPDLLQAGLGLTREQRMVVMVFLVAAVVVEAERYENGSSVI